MDSNRSLARPLKRWLTTLAATLLLTSLSALPAHAEALVLEGKDGWLFPGWESLNTVDAAGIDASIALIQSANTLLAAREVQLLVLVVPMKAPFYPDRLPEGQTISPAVRGRYPSILAALARSGIKTIDAQPALHSVEQGKQTAFYRADYHWSAWSAEATAAALAEVIRNGKKLNGKEGTGTVLGEWVSERSYGDLAAHFLSPEKRKAIGRDVFQIRSAALDKKDLLDDAPAPVHVVGNSFVQPHLGFAQKLSSSIDRPVSLTWNPGNIGPWFTFLQYLESKEFAQQKPQFIVWQFNEGQMHLTPKATSQWDAKAIIADEVWRSRVSAAINKK